MTQELYIDNVLMDVSEDTQITLSYKSNLLRDVSESAGNSSFTINLPLTARNRAAIGVADVIAAESLFPYYKHTAKYIRNGIVIIDNAVAHVVSIEETIEMVLVWGINKKLSQLITNGTKLNEFNDNAYLNYWNPLSSYVWGTYKNGGYSFFYAHSDWNKPLEEADKWQNAITNNWLFHGYHPCARVTWIIYKIYEQFGITLSFPNELNDVLNVLCVPLINDAPADWTVTSDTINITGYDTISSKKYLKVTDNDGSVMDVASTGTTKLTVSAAKDVTVSVNLLFTMPTERANVILDYGSTLEMVVVTDNNQKIGDGSLTIPFERVSGDSSTTTIKCKGDVDVELSGAGYGIMFRVNSLMIFDAFLSQALVGGTFSISNSQEHVNYGEQYPIAKNLPEITIIDFIKTLCVLLGVFPKQTKDDTIYFIRFAKLWENKTNAVDWTRRVIPSYIAERPQGLAFTVDSWAQNNKYEWNEVQTTRGEFNGSINIPNETLELERVVFELPFAITKTNNAGQSQIPIYQLNNYDDLVNGTSTTPTFDIVDCPPVLCTVAPKRNGRYFGGYVPSDDTKELQIGVDGLRLQNIIDERYKQLVASLSNAVVITERIRISDYELSTFDETIPVYLQQYGRFFAPLEINANADGTANVKMLALSINDAMEEPEPVLPYDAEIEYIESTGTQYIDTGIVPTVAKETQIVLVLARTASNQSKEGMGANGNLNILQNSNEKTKWRLNAQQTNVSITNGTFTTIILKQTSSGRYYEVGGETGYGTSSENANTFCVGVLGGATSYIYKARYARVVIIENGNSVRDMIPVRVGQTGYLYDRVSEQLFGNVGTGDFVLGNDVN